MARERRLVEEHFRAEIAGVVALEMASAGLFKQGSSRTTGHDDPGPFVADLIELWPKTVFLLLVRLKLAQFNRGVGIITQSRSVVPFFLRLFILAITAHISQENVVRQGSQKCQQWVDLVGC